jgi:hypothetical protein
MKIGNIIIHRASTMRKILVRNVDTIVTRSDQRMFDQVFQAYQCRVFGICIYRSTDSDERLKRRIIKEAKKKEKP